MEDEGSGRLPVFLYPNSVEFVASDSISQRQILTLYNPYNFSIAYKVLSTAPQNYTVGEPEGVVKAKCCKDIVIRNKHAMVAGTAHKLRVEIRKLGDDDMNGQKDLLMRVVQTATERVDTSQLFAMQASMTSAPAQDRTPTRGPPPVALAPSSQLLAVIAALGCAIALFLPTAGESTTSSVPVYFHLTLPQKLVAAYILGIVTILIVRPHN